MLREQLRASAGVRREFSALSDEHWCPGRGRFTILCSTEHSHLPGLLGTISGQQFPAIAGPGAPLCPPSLRLSSLWQLCFSSFRSFVAQVLQGHVLQLGAPQELLLSNCPHTH